MASSVATKKELKKFDEAEFELSEDDKLLQNEINLIVLRLQESQSDLYLPALEALRSLIRASTTSMTSVPKPLKFMRGHYDTMKNVYKNINDEKTKQACADIISVLAMTMGTGKDCLVYRFLCDPNDKLDSWGHEYIRHLSGEIALNWLETSSTTKVRAIELVKQIVAYNMIHNAEADACDLLMEIEQLDMLKDYVDENAYPRVFLYLQSCIPFIPDDEIKKLLKTGIHLSLKFKQFINAMRLALILNDAEVIKLIFNSCSDDILTQKQLAFMLGRQKLYIDFHEFIENDELIDIISNTHLSSHFINFTRELNITEAKIPEDIYKSHLGTTRVSYGSEFDSAKQNLAASFVNGFLNAGFGQDKLICEDGNKWVYKNKDHGMLSATASLGLIFLWDIEGGLSAIDKYLYSTEDNIKAGALLACGIINSGIRNEVDPAKALLSDYVTNSNKTMKIGAILGLSFAYAGSNRADVLKPICSVFETDSFKTTSMDVVAISAISIGLIGVGSCNPIMTEILLEAIMMLTPTEIKTIYSKFLPLGIGLLYLGKQESVEVVMAALNVLPDPFGSMAKTMVEVCAYAGTGNVLKVQQLLHLCSEHFNLESTDSESESLDDKENKTNNTSAQSIAVIGIALIAMGEEIGNEIVVRHFSNLLQYCEAPIRRIVPLALGLIAVSDPKMKILDILSRFSHDNDPELTYNAIFAIGLIGAGTNNARIASMLRNLAQYYAKDPNNLFMVRIAQGLTHLGKGTFTLNAFHSDRQIMSPIAIAGLLTTIVSFLDIKYTILGPLHYFLYYLVPAMHPRMLVTLDEDNNPFPVQVRVGMAVDTLGQAGKPKTITGFQTHTTPVLLAIGERAELATEEYVSLTPVLEGFVIIKKNPNNDA